MTDELKNKIKSFIIDLFVQKSKYFHYILKEQESGYIRNEDDGEYNPIDFNNVANLDMFLETAIGLLKESIGE